MTIKIEEEDRQALLLAIARLSLERPGWHYYLTGVADELHGVPMFEQFRALNSDLFPKFQGHVYTSTACQHARHKECRHVCKFCSQELPVRVPPGEPVIEHFDITNGRNRYRPCPQCGSPSGMGLSGRDGATGVACILCGYEGPRYRGKPSAELDKRAFDAWNDVVRQSDEVANLQSEIERLRAALEAAMPQISRCSSWQCDHDGHKDCAWGLAHAALERKR